MKPSSAHSIGGPLAAASLFVVAVGTLATMGYLPLIVPIVYLGASILAFVFYAFDKFAAKRGLQRTPESTLHLVALVGGWPGAWIAQNVLRHKTIKSSFQGMFWATVVLNCAALWYFMTPPGASLLRSWFG